jgi:hypothetical protein
LMVTARLNWATEIWFRDICIRRNRIRDTWTRSMRPFTGTAFKGALRHCHPVPHLV